MQTECSTILFEFAAVEASEEEGGFRRGDDDVKRRGVAVGRRGQGREARRTRRELFY